MCNNMHIKLRLRFAISEDIKYYKIYLNTSNNILKCSWYSVFLVYNTYEVSLLHLFIIHYTG
jgi:hypothetical protein